MQSRWGGKKFDTPLFVHISIYCTEPKTTKLPHPKPDVDNFAKGVMDAMNDVVYVDDSLIQKLIVEKFWVNGPGRVHVIVEEI